MFSISEKKPLQLCKKLVFTDTDTSCHTVIRINIGDFIEYKDDFATGGNRIGKVDGIFVRELLGTRTSWDPKTLLSYLRGLIRQ